MTWTIISVLWILFFFCMWADGWRRYRKNPRWHGNMLLNVAPPGEPPLWCSTVTGQRFTNESLPDCVTYGGLFDWLF